MIPSDIACSDWQDIPRTLAIIAEPITPCSVWRIIWPFTALTSRGFVADWVMSSNIDTIQAMLKSKRYNTFVSPRFVFQNPETFAELIHTNGMRWIFETDDDLISSGSVQRQMTHEPKNVDIENALETNRQLALKTLNVVDGVSVSSEPLANIMRLHTNAPVSVVPNAINLEVFRMGLEGHTRSIPPLTIGWAGGCRDDTDVSVLTETWPIIAERYPHVRFVVAGYQCRPLINCLPFDRITFLPGVSFDDYPSLLLNFDIMCCVVAPSRWNENKTGVKFWEASVAGAACVTSDTLYSRYVTDGSNALVASNVHDWVSALSVLIEDAAKRAYLVRQARKTIAENHTLEKNWSNWLYAWRLVNEQVAV